MLRSRSKREVATGEGAILTGALVPHRDLRRDAGANQPAEELAGAVGCISGETLRLEPHSLLGPLDHGPGGGNLVVGSRRRGLDIHDDGVLDVDQIIEPITELHALICFRGPRRARVAQRDHFRRLAVSGWIVVVQRPQELGDRTCLALRRRPIRFLGRNPVIPAGIRFHHAGVDRKALAFDKTRVHTCPHNGLEHMPKGIALAKAAVPIDREHRRVGHLAVEIETTEPAIGKVKLHFLAQPTLRTDAVAIADNQHPDHELGVDRRPADLAVKGPQLLAKVRHYPCHHRIDAAKKMVRYIYQKKHRSVPEFTWRCAMCDHGRWYPADSKTRWIWLGPLIATKHG